MNKPMLGIALAATIAAALYLPQDNEDDVVVAVKPRNTSSNAATPALAASSGSGNKNAGNVGNAYQLQIIPREAVEAETRPVPKNKAGKPDPNQPANAAPNTALASVNPVWGDNLFASTNWAPPPPPPPKAEKPQPAPPPMAPPLPFRFMGRWVEDGKVRFFLQVGERNLVVQVGDTIEQQYKLDAVQGGQMRFTYLPLQQQQTLAVGDVN